MFSKSRINDSGPKKPTEPETTRSVPDFVPSSLAAAARPSSDAPTAVTKAKPAASVLSSDLTITGNLRTTGDVLVEGVVDGDIRAHLLTVGESATIRGEIVADDIVINGRVIGRVRGLKVRLTSTARVEGGIIHKTIAIESGAHFEGSVQRQDDPLASATAAGRPAPAAAAPTPTSAAPAAAAAPSAAVTAATAAAKNAKAEAPKTGA